MLAVYVRIGIPSNRLLNLRPADLPPYRLCASPKCALRLCAKRLSMDASYPRTHGLSAHQLCIHGRSKYTALSCNYTDCKTVQSLLKSAFLSQATPLHDLYLTIKFNFHLCSRVIYQQKCILYPFFILSDVCYIEA